MSISAKLSGKAIDVLERMDSTSIVECQVEVNNFLSEISGSTAVFFVWVQEASARGIVNVVGHHILDAHLMFPVPSAENVFVKKSQADIESFLNSASSSISTIFKNFPNQFSIVPVRKKTGNDHLLVACFVGCNNFENIKETVEKSLRYFRATLIAAFSLWVEQEKNRVNQELIDQIDYIYLKLGDLHGLVEQVCDKAREILKADCFMFFVASYDGNNLTAKAISGSEFKDISSVKIPVVSSLTGQAMCTGNIVIFQDAWKHPYYNNAIEIIVGGPAHCVLTFPVRDSWNRVIAVGTAVNKIGFTEAEMRLAAILSTHFGLSVMHELVQKRIQQSHSRRRNMMEIFVHHLFVRDQDVQFVLCNKEYINDEQLSSFKWVCREVTPEAMPRLAMQMFESLGFIKSCRMRRSTLCRFILLTRKCYRPIAYHNWMHAFSVAHFAFSLMKSFDLIERSLITELEGVALLVALLCHDLDHRGTTNAFQAVSKTVLASMYESQGSIMERHHFSMTLRILSFPGCNIFEEMDAITYRRLLELIKIIIIATDLGVHLSNLAKQKAILNEYNSNFMEHRGRFLSLIASSSDMNDQVKGWRNSKEAAIAVYAEFFAQGDLEKEMGLTPMAMMDRSKAEVPNLQVQFITDICLPMYRLLTTVTPAMHTLIGAAEENIECWKRAQVWYLRIAPESRVGLSKLNEPALEMFINKRL